MKYNAMNMWGSGDMAPHILNLGTGWSWCQLHSQADLQLEVQQRYHWTGACESHRRCELVAKTKIKRPVSDKSLNRTYI
jgi:hypothetical protein